MSDPVMIVVAYEDQVRQILVSSLARFQLTVIACETFRQAESHLLSERGLGVLVDLVTMVKAKGEEKIIAFTLASLFPTLRVRTLGTMLVPMTMSGDAKQDKNLNDFVTKTCAEFNPRRLRMHKRREICLSALVAAKGSLEEPIRCFTRDISWGGALIVVMEPERFETASAVTVHFPDFQLTVEASLVRINPWGGSMAPGIGVRFTDMPKEQENMLTELLRSSKDADPDRFT